MIAAVGCDARRRCAKASGVMRIPSRLRLRVLAVLALMVPALGAAAAPARHPAMIAAANPHAVDAGLAVLRQGGSAIDAAVAVQATLGLVEPQSSGLGGGAFLVYYDAASREVTYYDGREIAPASTTPGLFLGPDGKPLPFREAVVSGRATGVPGALPMLAMAQREHGKRPWASLFGPSIRLADEGFVVSPRLSRMISSRAPQSSLPDAVAYFSNPDGSRMKAGDRLRNRAYAQTLRRLAADPMALHHAPIAQRIVAKVSAPPLPGGLTTADLAAYRPRKGDAVCGPYRVYIVCTSAPPSSGPALLEALAILERTDIAARGPDDPQAWYLFAEASRLMYADRDAYFADPAFVHVPVGGLLDSAYLDARARMIGPRAAPTPPAAGRPKGAPTVGADATAEVPGTSHMVIVDSDGNVVSMTTTVESIFGTGRMVDGFFLNNQLTDFAFAPIDAAGRPVANAPAASKRPRSSMSPVIVLDRQGRLVAALGSPGGNSILAYNLKTLVGVLDWKLSMQQAIDLPNLIARGASFAGELDKFSPEIVAGLAARGVVVTPGEGEDSGTQGIIVRGAALEGGADPRREGVAKSP
jgi:gamma-glutamyltranspeptidase / glutathione hydrolase